MTFSAKTPYATRHTPYALVSLMELAAIHEQMLTALRRCQILRRCHILRSLRSPKGGCQLARPPARVLRDTTLQDLLDRRECLRPTQPMSFI